MKKYILLILFILSLTLHFGGNGVTVTTFQNLRAQQQYGCWNENSGSGGGFFSWLRDRLGDVADAVVNVANAISEFLSTGDEEGEGGEEFGNEIGSDDWVEPSGTPDNFFNPLDDPWFQPEGFGQEEWDILNNLDYWYSVYANGGNPTTQDCNGVWGGSAYNASCGCIGGTTGITSCPQTCSLVLNNITIGIDKINCLPAESITLSVAITKSGSGATDVILEWEASYSGGPWKYLDDAMGDLNLGSCNNFIYQMRVLGTVSFRLKAVYACNGITQPPVYSNAVQCISKYCATDFQSSYSSNFNTAWNNTISSHLSNANLKYEYGFSLNFKGTTLTFETNLFNSFASCGTEVVGNNYDSEEQIIGPNSNVVKFGGTWTIGAFHTHPTVTNCPSGGSDCYAPGPSSIDISDAASWPKYPRVVRTYSNNICAGHSSSLPYQDYTFSSPCTTY